MNIYLSLEKTKQLADQMMIDRLKQDVSELNEFKHSSNIEMSKNKKILHEVKMENSKLNAQLSTLREQLELSQKELIKTKSEFDLNELNARNATIADQSQLQKQINELAELKGQILIMSKKVEALESEKSHLKQELESTLKELIKVKSEVETAKKTIGVDKQMLKSKNEELVESKSQNLCLTKRLAAIESEKELLSDQVDELTVKQNKMQQKQKKLAEDNKSTIAHKNQELVEMNKTNSMLTKKVSSLEKEIAAISCLNEEISKLEEKITSSTIFYTALNTQQTEEVNKLNEERLKHFNKIATHLAAPQVSTKRKCTEILETNREEAKSSKKV
jgi:chromosome segregation ATPase